MKSVTYTAKFPSCHQSLLEAYSAAFNPKFKDRDAWAERARGMFIAFNNAVADGVFPKLFTDTFWEDIQNVMSIVHKDMDLGELSEQQKILTFAIANLRHKFGGK